MLYEVITGLSPLPGRFAFQAHQPEFGDDIIDDDPRQGGDGSRLEKRPDTGDLVALFVGGMA